MTSLSDVVLVKLGGAALTHKQQFETLNQQTLERYARNSA